MSDQVSGSLVSPHHQISVTNVPIDCAPCLGD